MSTKPYICGSNYILKMSNFKKDEWCDTLDGLYWKFIDDHRQFFSSNPRLSLVVRSLDKIKSERKEKIYKSANKFIEQHTVKWENLCQIKLVRFAIFLLIGEKSGKRIGMRYAIVHRHVEVKDIN